MMRNDENTKKTGSGGFKALCSFHKPALADPWDPAQESQSSQCGLSLVDQTIPNPGLTQANMGAHILEGKLSEVVQA